MGFSVVNGKDLHGQLLAPGVRVRIEQADAAVGFLTLREPPNNSEFNSHIWVRGELVSADTLRKPIVPTLVAGEQCESMGARKPVGARDGPHQRGDQGHADCAVGWQADRRSSGGYGAYGRHRAECKRRGCALHRCNPAGWMMRALVHARTMPAAGASQCIAD